MIAVDLHPRGAFHVGELGVGREETMAYIPSDTLYAALVSTWVACGEPEAFDPPPLRLTSAFPRVGTLRLYPRPLVRIRAGQEQRDRLGKALSKFDWCSARIFALLVGGADMTALAVKENLIAGIWFHPDDQPESLLLPADGQRDKFWASKPPVPHVTIDRSSNAPNLFHTGRTTFGPGCGLWFGVEYVAPDAAQRLAQALARLADEGLGGLRSTGHGAFTFDVSSSPTPLPGASDPSGSGCAVTLSRYLPASPTEVAATLKARGAAYKLVHVGGWCQDNAGHPWRRKQVRFVCEGSVIGWPGGAPGRIANLVPDGVGKFGDRPVLRYGLAFPVPVAQEALL